MWLRIASHVKHTKQICMYISEGVGNVKHSKSIFSPRYHSPKCLSLIDLSHLLTQSNKSTTSIDLCRPLVFTDNDFLKVFHVSDVRTFVYISRQSWPWMAPPPTSIGVSLQPHWFVSKCCGNSVRAVKSNPGGAADPCRHTISFFVLGRSLGSTKLSVFFSSRADCGLWMSWWILFAGMDWMVEVEAGELRMNDIRPVQVWMSTHTDRG